MVFKAMVSGAKPSKILLAITCLIVIWLLWTTISLAIAATKPSQAYFVLGGNNTREIHAAELVAKHPQMLTLISGGSPDPCIWNAFQRANAPMDKVWLEKCADSTFGNMYYGLPILRSWKVSRITVIDSHSHEPRAQLLAGIIFATHGIWTDFDILDDGFPAKPEWDIKTALDVIRACCWAVISQFYYPHCSNVTQLSQVDMNYWNEQGYHCAHHINPLTGQIENDSVVRNTGN
ncbi:MAG: YdcF family protein [Candidatus Obscuribacterales bacterium]|nr:YdcF family protein [Candidatus Obscuribacterales bacterium]